MPDVSYHPITDLVSLVGRSGVVTGGGRGLGKAIAARLAEAASKSLSGTSTATRTGSTLLADGDRTA